MISNSSTHSLFMTSCKSRVSAGTDKQKGKNCVKVGGWSRKKRKRGTATTTISPSYLALAPIRGNGQEVIYEQVVRRRHVFLMHYRVQSSRTAAARPGVASLLLCITW